MELTWLQILAFNGLQPLVWPPTDGRWTVIVSTLSTCERANVHQGFEASYPDLQSSHYVAQTRMHSLNAWGWGSRRRGVRGKMIALVMG